MTEQGRDKNGNVKWKVITTVAVCVAGAFGVFSFLRTEFQSKVEAHAFEKLLEDRHKASVEANTRTLQGLSQITERLERMQEKQHQHDRELIELRSRIPK